LSRLNTFLRVRFIFVNSRVTLGREHSKVSTRFQLKTFEFALHSFETATALGTPVATSMSAYSLPVSGGYLLSSFTTRLTADGRFGTVRVGPTSLAAWHSAVALVLSRDDGGFACPLSYAFQ
jgi:hypothetical protein